MPQIEETKEETGKEIQRENFDEQSLISGFSED